MQLQIASYYRIAGDFWGAKYSWLAIFIVIAALQVKVGKVGSFVGKIFVVRPSTPKTTNLLPQAKINYPLYGIIPRITPQFKP